MKKLIVHYLVLMLALAPLETRFAFARHGDDDDSSSDSDQCTKSEYSDYKSQLKVKKGDFKDLQTQLDDAKKEQRRLTNQTTAQPDEGSCDICVNEANNGCNKFKSDPDPNPCKDGTCEVPLSAQDICYAIFRNKGCYNRLSGSLRGKVDDCWHVQHDQGLVRSAQRVKNLTDQVSDARKDQEKLEDEVQQCIDDCPACQAEQQITTFKQQHPGMNVGLNSNNQLILQPNQPSTLQMVLAGLSVGGSLILGGVNSYLGYKASQNSLGAYNANYNAYVANATKEGIPFYPPNPYGGQFGSSISSYGANPLMYGLSAGLNSLGAMSMGGGGMYLGGGMGMGGMGMGMGGGIGIGIGGGYPSSGYPYSYPGLGGYAGIGGYPGGMGGMFSPGYPSNPYGPYSSMGIAGGIGIGMPGVFPNGGIFPGAGGGMMVGPYTGVPYMNQMPMQSSIFSSPMGPFWGSPMAGMNMPATMGIGMAMGMMPGGGYGGIPGAMGIGFSGMSGMPMGMGYGMMPSAMPMGMSMGMGMGMMPTAMPMAYGMMPTAMGMMPSSMGLAVGFGFAPQSSYGMGFTPAFSGPPGYGMAVGFGMSPPMAMGMMPMPGMMPVSSMGMAMGGGMAMGMGFGMMPTAMPGGYGMMPGGGYGMMPTAMGMAPMAMGMMPMPMPMPGGYGMMPSAMGMSPGMGFSPMPGMMGYPTAMGMMPNSMGMGMAPMGMGMGSFGPSPGFTPPVGMSMGMGYPTAMGYSGYPSAMGFSGMPTGYPSSYPPTFSGPMSSPYMPMMPMGGMPGYVSGFPGIPTGSPYGPFAGPGSIYGPGFPGGPSMQGFGPSSSMYSPAYTSSWPMSGQYYGNQMGGIASSMSGTNYYSAQYNILQAQMNDVQSRYYQTMMGAGGMGYGAYGSNGSSGYYYSGGAPPPSVIGPPGSGVPSGVPSSTGSGRNTF